MQSNFAKRIKEIVVAAMFCSVMAPAAISQQRTLETVLETELQPLMRKSQILEAVKASNAIHADSKLEQVIALDKEWASQIGKDQQPLIRAVLNNPASQLLRSKISDTSGLITEIIVMDAKGITVGCWPATSDLYQGDEDQFKMTYLKGANARHIGPERLDESTHLTDRQLSLTLVDPVDGQPIGAITFGLNADYLR